MNLVYLSIIKINNMNKENVLDLVEVLLDDYLYFKSIGDYESAEECNNEIEKYLDKVMGDE
jgi:hypothetical protein